MRLFAVILISLFLGAGLPGAAQAFFPNVISVDDAKKQVQKAEQSGTDEEQATAYVDLAMAYIAAGDFSLAEPYYRKAVALYKELKQIPEIAKITETIAELYDTFGVKEKACAFWKDAEDIWQSAEQPQGEKIYDVQARIKAIQGLMAKAGCR